MIQTPQNNIDSSSQREISTGSGQKRKKVKLVIEEDEKGRFVKQDIRKDILENMLLNTHLKGKELFELIMTENGHLIDNPTREGLIFEAICKILIILKCIENMNYTEIRYGQLQNSKQQKNFNNLLKVKVAGDGNNIVDMSIRNGNTDILISVKHARNYGETDVSKIYATITKQKITNDFKIALIVKDKKLIINHRYMNGKNIDKQLHDEAKENNLIFDENDVINALDVFCQRFRNNTLNINDFIDFVNSEYLLSPRQQLVKKLHQKMTELKFINSFLLNKHRMWCIAHKPRSGKSILMLSICKYLLGNGYNKILIMTSVPGTIDSFTKDLEKWIDFKGIDYKLQKDFGSINGTFKGIVFCSTEYLKINKNQKKEYLKNIGFDAIITDEAHLGGSTEKTKTDILNVDNDIEEIRQNIKLNIFASGTADKTKKYYGIHPSCVYEWEIQDEAYMKELMKPSVKDKEKIIEYMVNRHGKTFVECLENDNTLNKDYSKHPTQVLMKYSIPELLIAEIKEYNSKYGTNFGHNCASLFALIQFVNDRGEPEYAEEFELCKTNDGISILKGFLDSIISKNRMRTDTIMKQIENTQTSYNSRKSTVENPLLFIMYLPTHTRNNTISSLQKTLKKFVKDHDLWSDYNIEYSNSTQDTGNVKEEYNEFIQTIMDKTKKENKRGCILLLGNKGSVGITYHDCDVTISLDDGHNLDNQKQRFSRALTEANGKTIGINVDMNIQRTYLYLNDIIQRHRRTTKTTKTNAEILQYLFEHNIFLFDPQQINNGKTTTLEITYYYQKEAENIMKQFDDTDYLEKIVCNDDMRDFILMDFQKKECKNMNPDFEGEQQHCPKGDKTKTQINSLENTSEEKEEKSLSEEETEKIKILINQTREMCKSFLFPLLALISRSYKIFDFNEIFTNPRTKTLIISLIKNKKIDLNDNNYIIIVNIMNSIIDNNEEIVNNIREIYNIAPGDKLRVLIGKHFIPTNDEKQKNAEVPTPVIQVDDMLDKTPDDFWKTPHKVFEPCCGKGNFVLGIFDKFYKGLEEMYPDEIERCHVIITDCIYYADITALNVFITTEILKCHIQSWCSLDEFNEDWVFHSNIGNTLDLNINEKWGLDGFDAVIGNPPYNNSQENVGKKGGGDLLWNKFVEKSLNEWLVNKGLLLFVHPPGWRKPESSNSKYNGLFKLMTSQNQMIYLEIHDTKDGMKVFQCGTRYDWYLIEKTATYKNTTIKSQNKEVSSVDLSKWTFLPNEQIEKICKLLKTPADEKCNIIYGVSNYETRKTWVNDKESPEYKYTLVHSTPQKGVRFMYSSRNDNGHFGIPKIIFGDSGIYNVVVDIDGKYGMTQHAMGIQIDNMNEGSEIKRVIESKEFKEILDACSWSNYQIDWRLFTYFKKDFWKEVA